MNQVFLRSHLLTSSTVVQFLPGCIKTSLTALRPAVRGEEEEPFSQALYLLEWSEHLEAVFLCNKWNKFKGSAVRSETWLLSAGRSAYTPRSGLHFCPSCKAELLLLRLSCSLQKLKQKNQQLKQIMDQLRNLIWEINSMLAIRSWDATGQKEVKAGLLTVNRSPQTRWEHGNDDALHLQRSRRGGRRWWWQKVFCLPRWDLSRKHILICSYLNCVNSRIRKAFINGP